MRGIERKLHNLEEGGLKSEKESVMAFAGENEGELSVSTLLSGSSVLSRWGIRSSSLNDVLRYLVYMRVDFNLINSICAEITLTYNLDKKIAY